MPTSFDCRGAVYGVVLALLLAVPAAKAKTVLDPGLWQDTETGIENGRPVKSKVTTDCMSAKDAEDPTKSLMAMKGSGREQCRKVEVRHSGNSFSFNMSCGDPKQFSMDLAATYTIHDRRHYSGRMKSTIVFGGHKSTSDKQMVSKWIGVCKN